MRKARVDQAFERAYVALEMAARLVLASVDCLVAEGVPEEGAAAHELTAPLRMALDVLDVAEMVAEEEQAEAPTCQD